MNLTDKLISKSLFRWGAALIITGIFSFGVYNCVNTVYNLEKQAETYLENIYSSDSIFNK